jgi:hypothetical protein
MFKITLRTNPMRGYKRRKRERTGRTLKTRLGIDPLPVLRTHHRTTFPTAPRTMPMPRPRIRLLQKLKTMPRIGLMTRVKRVSTGNLRKKRNGEDSRLRPYNGSTVGWIIMLGRHRAVCEVEE